MKTKTDFKWAEIINTCPLSFELLTRNADEYTKKWYPKEYWIYDSNVPASFDNLPKFFEANDVELKDAKDDEQLIKAFNELEKLIKEWNKNKSV